MNLGRKLTIATNAIASITRHDDAPIGDRIAAVETLQRTLTAELTAAGERDADRRAKCLEDTSPE